MHVEWFNVEGVTFDAACFAGFALIKQTSEKPITTIKNAFFIPLLIESEQTTTNYFLYFNETGRNRDTHWSITYTELTHLFGTFVTEHWDIYYTLT